MRCEDDQLGTVVVVLGWPYREYGTVYTTNVDYVDYVDENLIGEFTFVSTLCCAAAPSDANKKTEEKKTESKYKKTLLRLQRQKSCRELES